MATFLRSTLAGAVATLSDLVVLGVLISCTGLSARIASVPALLAGGIVNFYSNRHFAFRAKSGSLARQASLFTLVEIITLVLNGILFDYAAKAFHPNAAQALLMRLVISNVVFVCWSYPLWKRIFEQPQHVKTA